MKKFVIAIVLLLGTVWVLSAAEPKKAEIKPALLVIDVQNAYLPYMAEADREQAMENINKYIAMFRERNLPVIRIYHTDLKYGPKPGSEPFEFAKTIAVKESDAKVIKNYGNAFKKTELDKILKEKRINTLYLRGLNATACVLATYYGAMDQDYQVFMLKGALMSKDAQLTSAVEEICQIIGFAPLKPILDLCNK